ncbi:MAG: flavodoxin family protein [Erysipelotrichaceae bacterium]|nr:flavodoxin family protein [Erysipelotrichaceae bacterium]
MKLVIHDLNEQEWQQYAPEYPDAVVFSDKGTIGPCTGCFSCWNRTPGQCVLKDGYDRMGILVHEAEEVVIISRYTFGGFSGYVKNVIDRCLGYVLPQFEVIHNETHHKKRYDEDKPFTFLFYGPKLTEEEKENARRYAKAMCANFRSHVKDVVFRETGEIPETPRIPEEKDGKTILLNVSMRHVKGNSALLAKQLQSQLKTGTETIALTKQLKDLSGLREKLEEASAVVLCLPLYVDGLPSQLIRLFEEMKKNGPGTAKKIYVLANMGLYESGQLVNLFTMIRNWCREMGYAYCGGLGVSAGELIGGLMQMMPFGVLPMKHVKEGMDRLAQTIDQGGSMEEFYAEPYLFPRFLYIEIANRNWNVTARKNGISPKDLYRRL